MGIVNKRSVALARRFVADEHREAASVINSFVVQVFGSPVAKTWQKVAESTNSVSDDWHRSEPVVVVELVHHNVLNQLDHFGGISDQVVGDVGSACNWGKGDVEVDVLMEVVWHQRRA